MSNHFDDVFFVLFGEMTVTFIRPWLQNDRFDLALLVGRETHEGGTGVTRAGRFAKRPLAGLFGKTVCSKMDDPRPTILPKNVNHNSFIVRKFTPTNLPTRIVSHAEQIVCAHAKFFRNNFQASR